MLPYRPPEEIASPGPRLDMINYTYPEHFDIGVYPRVRQLNTELLRLYKQIGNEVDQLSHRKEECELYGSYSDAMNSYFRGKVKSAQADLKCSIGLALSLLAEVDAIGGQYHIPDVLKDKIKMKKYVTTGSLRYLTGVNFYFAEDMDAFLNFSVNHKDVLLRISSDVNRITFLQKCGNGYCGSAQYRGFYSSLKSGYKELQESNFQMNTPSALMDRVRQILGHEPKQVWKEQTKMREEKHKYFIYPEDED